MHDFTNLYTTLPHADIRRAVRGLATEIFERHEGKYLEVTIYGGAWRPLPEDGELPTDKTKCKNYDAARLLSDIDFILDNIYVTVGEGIFRQTLGVPMGFSCSPMLAVLMLAFFELRQVRRMVEDSERGLGELVALPEGEVRLTPRRRIAREGRKGGCPAEWVIVYVGDGHRRCECEERGVSSRVGGSIGRRWTGGVNVK